MAFRSSTVYSLEAVASQTFSHACALPVAPEHAWGALQEPSTWASIGGVDDVLSATFDHAGNLAGFSFAASVAGRRYSGEATVTSSTPPQMMSVDIYSTELAGSISVHLAPPHNTDVVAVKLSVRPRSIFAGMMFVVIAAAIGSGFPERVEAFASGLTTTA